MGEREREREREIDVESETNISGWARFDLTRQIKTNLYIYMYIYIVRERERDRDKLGERRESYRHIGLDMFG